MAAVKWLLKNEKRKFLRKWEIIFHLNVKIQQSETGAQLTANQMDKFSSTPKNLSATQDGLRRISVGGALRKTPPPPGQ